MTLSPLSLRCSACGPTYETDWTWRYDCGASLEFAVEARPARDAPDPRGFDDRRGLWSFADFLPTGPRVTLGEGSTPLVDATDGDAIAASSIRRTTW